MFISLAGEARDEGRAYGNIRNAMTHSLDQALETSAIAAALHQLQYILRSVLQRHVEILDGLWLLGEHIEKRIADVSRIGVHHAHPFNPVHMRKLAQQMSEGILLAKIFTVTR